MSHFIRWLCVLALACAGCTSRLSIETPATESFSAYRTWAWLPAASSDTSSDPKLGAKLEELLARGLVERGYEQVAADQAPDLLVAFNLSVTVQKQLRTQAHAREQLNTPWGRGGQTYVLDRPSTVRRVVYENGHLTIGIRDARDRRVVWSGEKRREVQGEFAPHLEAVLDDLLAHVPRRAAGS